MKKPKVLLLFSGGLDSRLVLKILKDELGPANLVCMIFKLPFGSKYAKSEQESLDFCKKENVKTKLVDCTKGKLLQDYLKIIRKPRYGRGSCINPCVDCKIFMFNLARKYADKHKIDIIATGEVLGERPMSQHRKAMDIVEQDSKLKGRLLRPLSAKLLPETDAEKKGIIKREKLFDIQGRGRKPQLELAKKYKINFPSPGGGCLLCEPEFCQKVKPLLNKKIQDLDIQLFKIGRHFENTNIVLGKNHEENLRLEAIHKKQKSILLIPEQPGPTALVKQKKYIKKAKELMQKFSKHEIKKIKEIIS